MLTEVFRVWAGSGPPYGKTVTASGNTIRLPSGVNAQLFSVSNIETLDIDINVSSLRGVSASLNFSYSRSDPFGNLYPVATGGLSAAGQITMDIGPGLSTAVNPGGQQGQFAWTLGGSAYSTTVTTGATSTTQLVGSTANMIVGDTLFFHTANVTVSVVTITDSTHVVVSASVASTTSEIVTVSSTPTATFTAFGEGK